jgi:tRNA dimethylallyltransferase
MPGSALPVVLLIGPTASGKSDAALTLAERFNGEIVSIDSALVYRDMNVGTAKPTFAERERIAHHLIDLIDPTERYSVAQFLTDCLAAIDDIRSRGKLPLLVGGTMMYADALIRGMSDVPPTDEVVRKAIHERRERLGIAVLHAELVAVDPITAARLSVNDTQRIERALEVWTMTGTPVSAMQGQRKPALADRPHKVILWTPTDRAWLHARCETRLTQMFNNGLVDEVKSLQRKYVLHDALPSMRCVGYRQVLDVLEARAPLAEMKDRALFATRQLAKRQLTWMRGMSGDAVECDTVHGNQAVDSAARIINRAVELTGEGT